MEPLDFRSIINISQLLLKLTDLEMSELLKVSRPTIGRWKRGVSSPHPLAEKSIYNAIREYSSNMWVKFDF